MIGPVTRRAARVGVITALVVAAGVSLSGCAGAVTTPAASAAPTPKTVSIGTEKLTGADICRTARDLISQGAPEEALDLIERYRDGVPTPTPAPGRRATASPSPAPSVETPTADCEQQRLAALHALGVSQAPPAESLPSAAEAFRDDWNRVVGDDLQPLAAITRMAVAGILLLVLTTWGVAWAARRRGPFRGVTSSTRALARARALRIAGGLLVVAAPIAFAFTLGLAWAPLSLLLVVLGVGGALLAARRPHRLRSSEIRLLAYASNRPADESRPVDTKQDATGARVIDPAGGILVVDRAALLVAEGYAPLGTDGHVPTSPADSGHGGEGGVSAAAHIAGLTIAPALLADLTPARGDRAEARTQAAALHEDPRVELWTGPVTSAVVLVDGDRRITATAEHGAVIATAQRLGLAVDSPTHGVSREEVVADAEAAAVVETLLAAAGRRPHEGWAHSLVLHRLASRAPETFVDALLAAALQADPTSLRVSGAILARTDRGGVDAAGLSAHLAALRAHIDAAAVADDAGFARAAGTAQDSGLIAEVATPTTAPPAVEPVPRGWEPWLADLLLAATETAIDLEAVSGRAADERSEADARRLVRLVADSASAIPRAFRASGGLPMVPAEMHPPTGGQMLAGVGFCELVPGERGSGSTVAGWAKAALTSDDPAAALAVARSFSLGWRDELPADRKMEIERRIRERLVVALTSPRIRDRVSTDAILRRHADHPWFHDLVAGS